MSLEDKKNFTDRLQFLGVIGPFVVLLTLFCTLLRGSTHGWYLFFSTLLGLPLSWKLRTRGFLVSMAFLGLLFLCMYPFFDHYEKLWQVGASLSLGLGLFVTFLGFEEIKEMIRDQTLESQSRLDNLIELDDQLKRSQKDWDLSEEDYQSKIDNKDQMIASLSDQADSLEKSTAVMALELKDLQVSSQRYIDELEKCSLEQSEIEVERLHMTQKVQKIEDELSLSLSDREKNYCDENIHLGSQLEASKALAYELEEKLLDYSEQETNLSEQASINEGNLKEMQDSLREKVVQIYELQDRVSAKDSDVKKQQEEIDKAIKKLSEKEHELVSIKSQLNERDRKINDVCQKSRDQDQDLTVAQAQIEKQKSMLKQLENAQDDLQLNQEKKINSKNFEVESLHKELEEKGAQLNKLIMRNNEVDQTIHMYEERVIELQEEMDEKTRKKHADLTKLNEARFALYQASLDKERLRKEISNPTVVQAAPLKDAPNKHWLLQLQSIMSQNKFRKVDLENLPKDLRGEIVTLNQSKALYKQLREQFEDKNKVLEEVRVKLFKAESQLERLKKEREQEQACESKLENDLEKNIFIKEDEIKSVEYEVSTLNALVDDLLRELESVKSS